MSAPPLTKSFFYRMATSLNKAWADWFSAISTWQDLFTDPIYDKASPGDIGGTTPGAVTATTVTATTFRNAGNVTIDADSASGVIVLQIDSAEKARIDVNGNLLVGVTSGTVHGIRKAATQDAGNQCFVSGYTTLGSIVVYSVSGTGESATNCAVGVRKDNVTSRSINAAGTLNASGADYAEYMRLIERLYGSVSKGALLGLNADGLLTDNFDEVTGRIYIKSTAPNLVGNDAWGSAEYICSAYDIEPGGEEPKENETLADWEVRRAAFAAAVELERIKWDRMAMCGRVPANIQGIVPADIGAYLVPRSAADGSIAAAPIHASALTLAQYISAIGIIEAILPDGRPLVSVKIA